MSKKVDIYPAGIVDAQLASDASTIAKLREQLAEARELLQEAWDAGTIWRGDRIHDHVTAKPFCKACEGAGTVVTGILDLPGRLCESCQGTGYAAHPSEPKGDK